jgi:hypothetical protein
MVSKSAADQGEFEAGDLRPQAEIRIGEVAVNQKSKVPIRAMTGLVTKSASPIRNGSVCVE